MSKMRDRLHTGELYACSDDEATEYNSNQHSISYSDNLSDVDNINNNDERKAKGHKNRRTIITIVLIIVALFVIVKLIFKDDSDNTSTYVSPTQSNDAYSSEQPIFVYKYEMGKDDVIDSSQLIPLNINDDYLNEFDLYLKNNPTNFKYEHLYNIDASYNNYAVPATPSNIKSSLVVDGKLSSSLLYNKVLENNDVYYNDKSNSVSSFYEEIKNSKILEICEIIADAVNYEVSNNYDLEINSVCKNLESLKIFYDTISFSNAYVNKNMCLCVNEDYIEKIFNKYTNKEDCFDEVIIHEAKHLVQMQSSDLDNSDGVEIGPFLNIIDSNEVNPMYISWIIESSAELKMTEQLNTDATTYLNMIGYLKSLNLAFSSSSQYKANAAYNISYKRNWNDVYEFFGAKTVDEKKEVIKCLFSIELSQTDNKILFENYKKQYGSDVAGDKNLKLALKREVSRQALLQLSKYFYKNICDSIRAGNFYLEDVFYLIRLWEADLLYRMEYNREDKYIECKEFIDSYNDLQRSFFTVIANSLGRQVDEIYNEFENYSMLGTNGKNYVLKNFDNKQKEFLLEMEDLRYNKGIPNLFEIPEIMENGINSKESY